MEMVSTATTHNHIDWRGEEKKYDRRKKQKRKKSVEGEKEEEKFLLSGTIYLSVWQRAHEGDAQQSSAIIVINHHQPSSSLKHRQQTKTTTFGGFISSLVVVGSFLSTFSTPPKNIPFTPPFRKQPSSAIPTQHTL